MDSDPLEDCEEFEWDEGNIYKNWDRHGVTSQEAEDVFFHDLLVVGNDARHSQQEKRFYALGQTTQGRRLFVAFAVRHKRIRVISVRDMNRRERDAYVKHENEADA